MPHPAARCGIAAQHAGIVDHAKHLPHLSARRQTECGRIGQSCPSASPPRRCAAGRQHAHARARMHAPRATRSRPRVFCLCVRAGHMGRWRDAFVRVRECRLPGRKWLRKWRKSTCRSVQIIKQGVCVSTLNPNPNSSDAHLHACMHVHTHGLTSSQQLAHDTTHIGYMRSCTRAHTRTHVHTHIHTHTGSG